MNIFIAGLDTGVPADVIDQMAPHFDMNLLSFFYSRRCNKRIPKTVIEHSSQVLIDSGAHSFQRNGSGVDWYRYTQEYCEWIAKHDCPTIVGFFEMDVDNVAGVDTALRLQEYIASTTSKMIPVWHRTRGIEAWDAMLSEYRGRTVAVTGFANEDIRDDQYALFLQQAWDAGCCLHCLGMTRATVINEVPFDSVDSATWKHPILWRGKASSICKRKGRFNSDLKIGQLYPAAYVAAVAIQKRYKALWRGAKRRYMEAKHEG